MDHLSYDQESKRVDNAMKANSASSSAAGVGNGGGGGGGFHSIRDRFRFKRNPNSSDSYTQRSSKTTLPQSAPNSSFDRQFKPARSHHHPHHHSRSLPRKLFWFPFKERSWFYGCIFLVIFVFALASMVLQSSIMSVFRQGGGGSLRGKSRWSVRDDLKLGTSLHFVPSKRFELPGGLDQLRNQRRIGARPPRIVLILGNMEKDPSSLLLSTVMKNLKGLGYLIKTFALLDGDSRPIWEEIGGEVAILSPERYGRIDWSIFEGVIADSLEAKDVISRLMQEPFCSVPLIWIIQEDTLANRLQLYESKQWEYIISHWKSHFCRANVVVFPDYSLP